MTNPVENVEFKKYLRYLNNQIIVIEALKMTVELPVNITMPLYDEICVHQSSIQTEMSWFSRQWIVNFKKNKLSFCDACFFAYIMKKSKR